MPVRVIVLVRTFFLYTPIYPVLKVKILHQTVKFLLPWQDIQHTLCNFQINYFFFIGNKGLYLKLYLIWIQ